MITLKLKEGAAGEPLGFKEINILISNFGVFDKKKNPYAVVEADGELSIIAHDDIVSAMEDYELK